MAVEKYGSKTDVIVKLVLVFFISLLSFSIGTFVGKKFSDNQHKISQLEPQHGGHAVASEDSESDRDIASVHPDSDEVKPNNALSDEEVKKLAEEFVADNEGMPSHNEHSDTNGHGEKTEEHKTDKNNTESHTVASNEHGKTEQTSSEHSTTAHASATHEKVDYAKAVEHANDSSQTHAKSNEAVERVVAGHSPEPEHSPEKPKSRIPQSLPKELSSSAVGKYTVQVSSYPTETEAQKLASSLKDKGFSAFYVTAKVKDKKTGEEKTWYRVSVGLFTTTKEAENYKKDLITRGKVSTAYVTKIAE